MTHPKITNKVVLVSGGVGSIGSQLVKTLLEKYQPKQIRILDNNETGLFNAVRQYQKEKRVRFLLGDIRDENRVNWAMRGVETVFHAAALKHVALNEYSPFESVKTNVIGTQNMLEVALVNKVATFINISTDKAANPTSTMGASKLLAERLTVGADYFKGKARTVFASVRFGNVLNSSGSVLPIFIEELKQGGPLTITDKKMVRYFMTIEEAVELIIKAAGIARGGEIFILKMPAVKITDLAKVFIDEYAPQFGYQPQQIKVKEVGRLPGEKLYEKIVTSSEAHLALELKDMYVLPLSIDYPMVSEDVVKKSRNYYHKLRAKAVNVNGVMPKKLLSRTQIKKLLAQISIK